VGSGQAIATIEQVARDTIGEIDRLVRALRKDGAEEPPTPADPAALEELVRRYGAAGLVVGTEVGGPRRALPGGVAGAAHRIIQEGLTNAARHGRGSAQVAVRFEPHALAITITNPTDERGPAAGSGHGIVGMRERAALLGGTLEAGVRHGVFRLCARLPYDAVAS
jgi:signal transduction histidine kinase